jgi:hypothetical protein
MNGAIGIGTTVGISNAPGIANGLGKGDFIPFD